MNLACFQKPSRYIGNEINITRKRADIKVALCFPDTYEIGMSHIGLKILYSIINSIPYAHAERVYAPWVDLESHLRKNNLPLTSLESKLPLKDFDIAGFTLQYELSYTNILNMLDLGMIPVKSADRKSSHPLVIAGGPCASNPLPLVPFIDAFVIGDGEEVIGEIIETYKNFKSQNEGFKAKENILRELSKLQGVYVPSVHSNTQKIKRRIVENLDKAPFPESPMVPFAQIVHDRVPVEISRGCTKGCRFCQAGMIYRPLRERSAERVLSLAHKSIANTGYEEISFTSLSTGDYSNLQHILGSFNKSCVHHPVSISLPSLRVGSVSSEVLKEIKSIRKTGFTIAPEAGTERLRTVINKDFTPEEYEDTLHRLFSEGWQNIKLYFMIGLPSETRDDIEGIIRMAESALKKGTELTRSRVNINVGVSAFVPKPHTPFQWHGQESYSNLREKQGYLRRALKKKRLNFRGQHIELSLLEAVFSRGNKDCALLLENAWRLGCRFDGWSECFDFTKWLKAAEKTGINLYEYAARNLDIDSHLPWEFIDTGITKEFLKSEYLKSQHGRVTPDCRYICYGCGLECKPQATNKDQKAKTEVEKIRSYEDEKKISTSQALNSLTSQSPDSPCITHRLLPMKVRIKFSKTGILRYLSHREVITAFLRAIRRAGIPLIYSEGFHPHPKISFGPPLHVGVEGLNEYFDVETHFSINLAGIISKINASLPDGLKLLSATRMNNNVKSLNEFISRYEYNISIDNGMSKEINSFVNRPDCMVKRGDNSIDIKQMVAKIEVKNSSLRLALMDTANFKVRLYEILNEILPRPSDELQNLPVTRTSLFGYDAKKGWVEPLEAINE